MACCARGRAHSAGSLALRLANGVATLSWQTSPAGIYQVQYRDDLTAENSLALGNALAATGGSLSLTDSVLGLSGRFYGVMLINCGVLARKTAGSDPKGKVILLVQRR